MKNIKSAASKFAEVAAEKKTEPTEKELEIKGQTTLPETKIIEKKEELVPIKNSHTVKTQKTKIESVPAASSADLVKNTRSATERAETEPETKVMGQPKKYDEKCKHVSFSLPISVIENLKIISHLKQKNQTQLILELIRKEIESNSDKIEMYRELMK